MIAMVGLALSCKLLVMIMCVIEPCRSSAVSFLRSLTTPLFNRQTRKLLPKKKVLILMSDTGGGHRASAIAIDRALQELYPRRMDVDIIDIWTDHAGWPFNRFVPSYRLSYIQS